MKGLSKKVTLQQIVLGISNYNIEISVERKCPSQDCFLETEYTRI